MQIKRSFNPKHACILYSLFMYRHNQKQLEFENFVLPFGGKLRSDNRWVKLAKCICWDEFEFAYSKCFSRDGLGRSAKSVRVALGALIIKARLGTSDEETVAQIRENPYLQYFLGFNTFIDEKPFDPSLFVCFRKRFGKEILSQINETIARKVLEEDQSKETCIPDDRDVPPAGRLVREGIEKANQLLL